MRIKEEYKRSGYFWLPNNPEKEAPGTLVISDGGKIELEIVGLLDDGIETLNGKGNLGRMIGCVEKDGLVTLENCFYKNVSIGGIQKLPVHVSQVLSGVAYDKGEVVRFNTLSFSIEGLDKWLGISGIGVAYGDDFKTVSISYTPPQEITYKLDNGFQLHIVFRHTLPGFPHITEAQITQKAYFKLSTGTEKELGNFIDVIYKITHLLCFAVNATVAVRDMIATSNSVVQKISENETRHIPIRIYYQSYPFSIDVPEIGAHKMLFTFRQIQDDAERIINNWLSAYAATRPPLDLYFSAVTGGHKYLEPRFLALAQCLETYHRRTSDEKLMDEGVFRILVAHLICQCPKEKRKWLRNRLMHGNEISLGTRMKKLIEPFKAYMGNYEDRNKLIRTIVNTRNYLTHYRGP